MISHILKRKKLKYKLCEISIFLALFFYFSFCHLTSYATEINRAIYDYNLESGNNIDSNWIFIPLSRFTSGVRKLFPNSFTEKHLEKVVSDDKFLGSFLEDTEDKSSYKSERCLEPYFENENTGYEKYSEDPLSFLDQEHVIIVGMMMFPEDSEDDDDEGENGDDEEEGEVSNEVDVSTHYEKLRAAFRSKEYQRIIMFLYQVETIKVSPELLNEMFRWAYECYEEDSKGGGVSFAGIIIKQLLSMLKATFEREDYDYISTFLLQGPVCSHVLDQMFLNACDCGAVKIISRLLFLGANPLVQDDRGLTVLHYLSSQPGSRVNLDIMRRLIEKINSIESGDINIRDNLGNTPLHIAARDGGLLQARLLLKNGADFEDRNEAGQTPANVAHDAGEHRLKRLLTNIFDDEEASDTDSEDETDYDDFFVDLLTQISRSNGLIQRGGSARAAILQGDMPDGSEANFQEEWIRPDGNCGFAGLETNRETLVRALMRVDDNQLVRDYVAEEIYGAIIAEPGGPARFMPSDGGAEFRVALDNGTLRDYLRRRDVFVEYLNALRVDHDNPRDNLWIGIRTMMVYAGINGIRLRIWIDDAGVDGHLALDTWRMELDTYNNRVLPSLAPPDVIMRDIDLLYRHNHFNRLRITDNPTETIDDSITPDRELIPMVVHYRGVHFYTNHFSRAERRRFLRLNRLRQRGVIPPEGLFSPASYELADLSFVPLGCITRKLLRKREEELKIANLDVEKEMGWFQSTRFGGEVIFCERISDKSLSSGFLTLYYDFIQRYVNSYGNLLKIMEGEDVGRSKSRIERRKELLGSISFTKLPLVSTSEDQRKALGYSVAEYCKKSSSAVLNPQYQSDGHPRFPYLGVVYIVLHQEGDPGLEAESSSSIGKLNFDLKVIYLNPRFGTHKERVFIGSIDAKHVAIAVVIRVPNFSHGYRAFYEKKYGLSNGLSKGEFGYFKRGLGAFEDRSEVEKEIIAHVVEFQIKNLLKLVAILAQARGGAIE